MAVLCDDCWNRLADEMADKEGATATPRPDPDPDDVTLPEPPTCGLCGADVRVYPTVYDRWVSLAMVELPAKDVPRPFRWRLVKVTPPRSPVVIDIVAVRVRGIDPIPGELVTPAHQFLCAAEQAEQSVVKRSLDR
ncbi:DUF6083 domain-containing protein [Streptomyces sp. NPDC086519]|uniref:DUF6083 domain-containing protein n=1 Tax=Streptomyces sp. NPDC086519 TaxID=3154863 RepID=UPI003426B151